MAHGRMGEGEGRTVSADTDPVPPELCDGDVVVEVGCYEGRWSEAACKTTRCTLHAFEPATRAYAVAKERLAPYPDANLWPVALGSSTGAAQLYDCMRDGANTTIAQGPSEEVPVVDVALVVRLLGHVDLMHLNAEGGELDILARLMDTGDIRRVKMLLVQWHPYNLDISKRIAATTLRLRETHELTRRHAWECWTRV